MIFFGQRIIEVIVDWIFFIRRDGFKPTFSILLKETAPFRRIKFVLVSRALSRALPEFKFSQSIVIRPFLPADLEIVRRENRPSEAKLLERRLEQKHPGLTALVEGEMAGYSWLSPDMSLERFKLDLAQGDVLFTDAFVFPSFRRRGVNTALVRAKLELARDLGYKRIIAYIEEDNTPSLAVWCKKMGAEVLGRLEYRRIGLWRKVRFTS